MKILTIVTLFVLSLSVSAYEIDTANSTISKNVENAIRAEISKRCEGSTESVKSLKLNSLSVDRIRIDQGYIEDHLTLSFGVEYKNIPSQTSEFFFRIVDVVADRSGQLEAYVVDFATESGDNCYL